MKKSWVDMNKGERTKSVLVDAVTLIGVAYMLLSTWQYLHGSETLFTKAGMKLFGGFLNK